MERVTKKMLLASVRDGRIAWRELLKRFNDAQMVTLRLPDGRTPKDVAAHVTWYEKQLVGVLRARALVGSELWDVSQEERNAVIYEENKDRPLLDVRSESERVFAELMGLLGTLDEADLQDPARFSGMPEDWDPWKLIAENTYEHYEGHTIELEEMMGQG